MSATDIDVNHDVSDIDMAYCRAALYSALSIGFQAPSDGAPACLLSVDGKASMISAAAMLSAGRQNEIINAIKALPDAVEMGARLASQYHVLFGHTARGQVPPYETEYGNEAMFQQPQELGDLMGFYHAFGLTLKTGKHERPDHVSCELEFLMFLALKEAYALEQDNREMLAETRKAEKLFLRDHLARFVPTFAIQLHREDAAGFYSKLAALCLQVVAADCTRLQVAPGAANLGLRPADDDRVPMACGSGSECAAMPGACTPDEADAV